MTLNLYAKSEYKMRPLARIKWWFKRAKYARQRARWGFSEYDVWDMDTYLAELIGNMTKYLSEHTHSHPYDIDDKGWRDILQTISKCFKQYNIERLCPAYEAYQENKLALVENGRFGKCVTVSAPDYLLEVWKEEERVNYKNKMEELKRGFDLLYEHYSNLWD